MYKRELQKADGRPLILYARHPIPTDLVAPAAGRQPATLDAHLRWHPLREEWVAYASHRQDRTFLPPPDFDPLAPTLDPQRPTELPAGDYDVAVFENLFPTLTMRAASPERPTGDMAPARGVCEVVVFTREASGSLGELPDWHIALVVDVWADRVRELGAIADVRYVFPFENRGVQVGVTLRHPHGQIYGYPFVPPVAQRELDAQRRHLAAHGRGLFEDVVERELREGHRIVTLTGSSAAFVPFCARFPYEVWIAPRRAAPTLVDLAPGERWDLALALKRVLLKLDALWDVPMPYVLVVHQAPTDGEPHPEAHVHIEIYPYLRQRDRLKYLAGSEVGAGVFAVDMLPESMATALRAAGEAAS